MYREPSKPNEVKSKFLEELHRGHGTWKKLAGSLSLFESGSGEARIYIRYSRIHSRGQGFYGLRKSDLDQLDGLRGFVVFLWDGQQVPLVIPSAHVTATLNEATLASDGQYKAGLFVSEASTELYFAGVGRFAVEGFYGWSSLDAVLSKKDRTDGPEFNHWQWQTLVGSLGARKGFDVWIPQNNRSLLDWDVAPRFTPLRATPAGFDSILSVIEEIDVMWMFRGAKGPAALFEIEYSTPIYSGLLRFNDVHLVAPLSRARYHIAADASRRDQYVRLINRPTFKASGLADACSFLDYQQIQFWNENEASR